MGKRIAFFADGTWDAPQSQTNVYKLFKATLVASDQMPFYDDGVGSDGTPLQKLTGGAFGDGILQKIKDGYTKIAQVYEANDELFLLGFSRGAYTARSLAGMIAICGLPTGGFDDNLVETAFQAYRNPGQRQALLATLGKCNLFDAKLTMVGVWDTVGSLGIPAILGGVSPLLYGFLDTSLHPDVLNAYQALAVDERRVEFPPTLWTSQPAPNQIVEQNWFSGVHCDVGGGYPESGLSDITFAWMLSKATALGLEVDPTVAAQYTFPYPQKHSLDQIHESWSPVWGFPVSRTIDPASSIANSVQIRYQNDTTYRPPNLKFPNDGTLANTYRTVQAVA